VTCVRCEERESDCGQTGVDADAQLEDLVGDLAEAQSGDCVEQVQSHEADLGGVIAGAVR